MPEVRRLLCLLSVPSEHHRFHLHWSWWRRAHQAVAQRGHIARRARGQPQPIQPSPELFAQAPRAVPRGGLPTPPSPGSVRLTDAQWARVEALLPAPLGRGRPARHQRRIVAGLLWLHHSGASWRYLPDEYGRWQTAYSRFRLWCADGTWPQILALLTPESSEVSL